MTTSSVNPWKAAMKTLNVAIAALLLMASLPAQAEEKIMTNPNALPMPMLDAKLGDAMLRDIRAIAPALEKYGKGVLLGDLWKRPDLALRDRSIVTLSALIAKNQTLEMPYYLNLALDNGVKPSEISE